MADAPFWGERQWDQAVRTSWQDVARLGYPIGGEHPKLRQKFSEYKSKLQKELREKLGEQLNDAEEIRRLLSTFGVMTKIRLSDPAHDRKTSTCGLGLVNAADIMVTEAGVGAAQYRPRPGARAPQAVRE